jgi:L-seryl-tRNA(Ser) seleniumtransferase
VLAALQETAMAYLRREGDAIPFWRMATVPVDGLRRRAAALGVGEVVDTTAVAGAGSLPGFEIPSAGAALDGDHSEALRAADPPVIARVHQGRTVLDLRTVDPTDDPLVAKAVAACT